MSILINLFGGPGAGKSTVMAGVFYKLKQAGIFAEMAPEFAKDLIWQKSTYLLANQLYVMSEQYKRIWLLVNAGVKVIVCDSPLLLGIIYDIDQDKMLRQLFISKHAEFNNINYFIERSEIFHGEGRIHTKEQSLIKDKIVLKLLQTTNTPYTKITPIEESVSKVTNDILKLIEKTKWMGLKTAKIVAIACDQGHYGYASCSNCNKTLPEPHQKLKQCPVCDYKFVNIQRIPYPFTGSDF